MKKHAILFVAVSSLVAAARAADTEVSLLETNVLRVRANRLTENFVAQLRAATPTNAVIGRILDLRAASGNPAATATAANYFSSSKTPLVILVDGQTDDAATALAKQLRAASAGIVIGSPDSLVQPDIAVASRAADDKIFLQNPYATIPTNPASTLSATNELLPYVDHTSEADLVRKRIKDGEDETDASNSPRAEPAQPVLRDPVLARAVDLLKALAILHPARD
jgi:hypothetical protein